MFLKGCFSCSMQHISLLTCLVRSCSAFSWYAERACCSAGIEGNCHKAKQGEVTGNHPVFPFHGGMSDVQDHMLRHYQLFNSQLGLGLPQSHTPQTPAHWVGKRRNQPWAWINDSTWMPDYRIHCHHIEPWHWEKGGGPIKHMMNLSLPCAGVRSSVVLCWVLHCYFFSKC